jgi:hypothetical protein
MIGETILHYKILEKLGELARRSPIKDCEVSNDW